MHSYVAHSYRCWLFRKSSKTTNNGKLRYKTSNRVIDNRVLFVPDHSGRKPTYRLKTMLKAQEILDTNNFSNISVPRGSRTPVAAVKGRCPGPLDDGDVNKNK